MHAGMSKDEALDVDDQNFAQVLRIQSRSTKFSCPSCKAQFTRKFNMERHKLSHCRRDRNDAPDSINAFDREIVPKLPGTTDGHDSIHVQNFATSTPAQCTRDLVPPDPESTAVRYQLQLSSKEFLSQEDFGSVLEKLRQLNILQMFRVKRVATCAPPTRPFSDENIEHIPQDKAAGNVYRDRPIDELVKDIFEKIWLNDDHPENHNIRVLSRKNHTVEVLNEDGTWKPEGWNSISDKAIRKVTDLIQKSILASLEKEADKVDFAEKIIGITDYRKKKRNAKRTNMCEALIYQLSEQTARKKAWDGNRTN